MKKYILLINTKRDFELLYGNKKIYVKRKFGGFVFVSKVYINEELVLKSIIKQVIFYRRTKVENFSNIVNIRLERDKVFGDNIYMYNNQKLIIKSKYIGNPNIEIYKENQLVLQLIAPNLFRMSNKYTIILSDDKDEDNLFYILCLLCDFAGFDIAV